jgi:hypothetical protein
MSLETTMMSSTGTGVSINERKKKRSGKYIKKIIDL